MLDDKLVAVLGRRTPRLLALGRLSPRCDGVTVTLRLTTSSYSRR